ncbi:hypothetical protein [Streptomyces sp. BH105]|uniref:hypothetical protein n=1 Tax=Streptomyces sp. BH105 TaxID=3410408 RepID=UPI003CF25B2A
MPEYPSITALDRLLDDLAVGEARHRQLGMVRGELLRALERDAVPVAARRSLRRLLEEQALASYLRLAESGALRSRLVAGGRPPTSKTTNEVRRQCLDVLREALGLPALQLGGGAPQLLPTPPFADLAALRRRLDRDLAGAMPSGQTRLTALLACALDAAPRAGEFSTMRLSHLAAKNAAVYVERRPQRGALPVGEWCRLSPLGRAAFERWLDVRQDLVGRAHGTSRVWVSLHPNHDGVLDDDGRTVLRPPGMPLEENGLISSYRRGRAQYDLVEYLPPKLEQLRRAVLAETPPVLVETPEPV